MSPTMLILIPHYQAVNGGRNRVASGQQGIRLVLGILLSSYLFTVIFCACHAGITSLPGSVSRTSPGIRVVQLEASWLAAAPENPPVVRRGRLSEIFPAGDWLTRSRQSPDCGIIF